MGYAVKLQNSSEKKLKYSYTEIISNYQENKSFHTGIEDIQFVIIWAGGVYLTTYPWTSDNGNTKYQVQVASSNGARQYPIAGYRQTNLSYAYEIINIQGDYVTVSGGYTYNQKFFVVCIGF